MAARTDRQKRSLRALSPATRIAVRERRRRLCRSVEGRVLDLSGAAPVSAFTRADEVVCGLDAAGARPGSIDIAVSVLWLSGVDDLDAALRDVAEVLAPKGELVFLDIVGETGIGRLGQRLVSPVLQRTAGWRVDRNLPALIRDAGWNITDLERIPMPRYVWPVHGLVEGRARLRAGASP